MKFEKKHIVLRHSNGNYSVVTPGIEFKIGKNDKPEKVGEIESSKPIDKPPRMVKNKLMLSDKRTIELKK